MLDPINFVVWNIRGASKMDSLRYLKKMKFDFNVKILVLLEPMSNEGHLDFVKRFVGYKSVASFVDGKIWVLWDLALTISFTTFADQLVDMEFSSPTGTLFLSVIYTRCTGAARRPLLSAMESLAISRQGPWMLAGDFNSISAASERLRGAPPNARNMEDFNQTIFNCGLVSVDFEGTKFTWTNGTSWQ